MKVVIRRERLSWHGGEERLKLLHLSDLHVKWRGRRLAAIEAVIEAERPDVIVMTGDYFDTPRGAGLCATFLERIANERPVCWISGNHDQWFGPEPLNQLRAVSAAHCVHDVAWGYESGTGRRYCFLSWQQHVATPPMQDERRVVLIHDPEDLDASLLPGCDLVLAGHLHGGQFILSRTRAGTFFPGNLLYRWCCDRREVGGTTVIVSKGLGDTLPLRFNCPHELVVIEIE